MNPWSEKTSVFLKSFWDWTPETWGGIGWTGNGGNGHRDKIIQTLSNPFICVIYLTKNSASERRGMAVGFFLMSHEKVCRKTITHPGHHGYYPDRWGYALRAERAFSFIPERCMKAEILVPELKDKARAIARWGLEIKGKKIIKSLSEIPYYEEEVYSNFVSLSQSLQGVKKDRRFNKAGPENKGGYIVSSNKFGLRRHLYILKLNGGADVFAGKNNGQKSIYKIGISASPEMRRRFFESAIPKGPLKWEIYRSTLLGSKYPDGFIFSSAVEGEYEMKVILSEEAEWMGGEFYLASDKVIERAWNSGIRHLKKDNHPNRKQQ